MMILAAFSVIFASLNCRVPPLIMLMLWYMYEPAFTTQVPFFTTRSTEAVPGPSGSLFVSGHTSGMASGKVGRRLRANDESSANARRSGFDESAAPLAETVQTKPIEKTIEIERNRAIPPRPALVQRVETQAIYRSSSRRHFTVPKRSSAASRELR